MSIEKAILAINPNANFIVNNNDINSIEWTADNNGVITTAISVADIEAKIAEMPTAEEEKIARENLKATAKAKLIAGEALTEDEANTIVL